MWSEDIDIELRNPAWPPRIRSVAAGRRRLALDRYLERTTQRRTQGPGYGPRLRLRMLAAWPGALAAAIKGRLATANLLVRRAPLLKSLLG